MYHKAYISLFVMYNPEQFGHSEYNIMPYLLRDVTAMCQRFKI